MLLERAVLTLVARKSCCGRRCAQHVSGLGEIPKDLSALERGQQTANFRNGISLLGYIGDGNDADFLNELARTELKQNPPDMAVVGGALRAMGVVASRGSKRASDLLQGWTQWRELEETPSLAKLRHSDVMQQAKFFSFITAVIFAASRDPSSDLQQIVDSLVVRLSKEEKEEWKTYAPKYAPERMKAWSEGIHKAECRDLTAEDRKRATIAIDKIPSDVVSALDLSSAINDSDERWRAARTTLTAKPSSPQELTADEKSRLATEAEKAFEHFRTALRGKEYKSIVDNLLHDSVFFTEGKLERDREQIISELPNAARVLAELELDEKALKDLTVEPDEKGVIVVRWRIAGSEHVGKRLQAERRADRESVDAETGELIVLLKKKNGKWYWNPFGW